MSTGYAPLLQLASPSLPVGSFSYSQGLEAAIDRGIVTDEAGMESWLKQGLCDVLARYEAPLWHRLYSALTVDDQETFANWNQEFLASRESRELRLETEQMGYSLGRLLTSLGHELPWPSELLSYPAAHALACHYWRIDAEAGLSVYLYGWCENQVTCAIKAIPIGQTSGQRLLLGIRPALADALDTALQLQDEELSSQNPMLAILSSQHETQYSRLFRS